MRRWTTIGCLAVCLASPWAHAQGGDKATAELLFNDGRRLMTEGKLETACEKLAESQRLDPAVGTLLNLAECQERRGQTASAWATWLEAAAGARASGQADREALARQRAEALKARLVTLTIEVPEAHRIAGLVVSRNGTPLGPALWGTAAPVDPGTHRITAAAPGYQAWSSELAVREGNPASVVVPSLTPEPAAAAPPSSAAPAPATPPPAGEPSARRSSGGLPIPALIAGGVGVIGLGVGAIFGLQAMSKNDSSKDHCESDTLCDEEGVALRDDAFDAAKISTISFVVGGAGLAAGAILWLTAPSDGPETTPTTGGLRIRSVSAVAVPGNAAFAVRGAF